MEGMAEKNLVRKEIIREGIEKWALLPAGEKMAKACLVFEWAVNNGIPSFRNSAIDANRLARVNNENITLIVDNREDMHFRERIRLQCQDGGLLSEERELPAGDYLFQRGDGIIPLVIERKSWSDLADSVHAKGKAHRRLECVKLGTNHPCCPRQNCQLCKMKRSGCTQVMFIIEGAKCRGKDNSRDRVCTGQKRCQQCKALVERHGADVTQETLEKVLTRLQVEHGCFVHFTRSYNETITSLFAIHEILQEGESFATAMYNRSFATGHSSQNAIVPINYEQFCAKARDSHTPPTDLRRKNGDILEWKCENLVSIITNNIHSWRSSIKKELIGTAAINSSNNNDKRALEVNDTLEHHASKKQRRDVIVLNDSEDDAAHLLDKDDDSSIGTINLLESDQEDEIVELEDSQDSIQILEVINTMGSDDSSVSVKSCLKICPLIVLHGWDDYDERFSKEINTRWQECYKDYGALVGTVDSNGEARTASSLRQYAVRQITTMVNQNSGAFPFLSREEVITSILWLQIRLGLLIRPVTRQNISDEMTGKWSNTHHNMSRRTEIRIRPKKASNNNHIPVSNNNCSKSSVSQSTAHTLKTPAVRKFGNEEKSSDSTNTQSYSSRQQKPSPNVLLHSSNNRPQPSEKELLAIEARLLRFEPADRGPKRAKDRSNVIMPSHPQLTYTGRQPSGKTWDCERCTLSNTIEAKICIACLSPNPRDVSFTQEKMINTSNFHGTAQIASRPSDLNVRSNNTNVDCIPSSTSSSSTKRPGRCGACGGVGHNRGSATEANCTAYNDEKETQRREEKWRKLQEKAITATQELEELQRDDQASQVQQERLRQNLEDMAKDLAQNTARRSERNADDIKRKKKQAESARRRAARQL
jgi:hypothetical protein